MKASTPYISCPLGVKLRIPRHVRDRSGHPHLAEVPAVFCPLHLRELTYVFSASRSQKCQKQPFWAGRSRRLCDYPGGAECDWRRLEHDGSLRGRRHWNPVRAKQSFLLASAPLEPVAAGINNSHDRTEDDNADAYATRWQHPNEIATRIAAA